MKSKEMGRGKVQDRGEKERKAMTFNFFQCCRIKKKIAGSPWSHDQNFGARQLASMTVALFWGHVVFVTFLVGF